ncbi:MAG TPA: tRNA (adenosine(37)-N6)-threonylcarbamoyltransferase complex transferase subunit TsaD [Candidatus Paceibacterota bacterium]
MIILGIETSCDETAVSVIVGNETKNPPRFQVLAQVVSSQVKLHAPWGGVVPSLAKREHSKNLIPVLEKALGNAKLKVKKIRGSTKATPFDPQGVALDLKAVEKILEREPELLEQFLKFIPTIAAPKINAIAVTHGPGLEPALWTGINLARALALTWQKPLIPVNHMAGHIYSVLISPNHKATPWGSKGVALKFPALALLISGGHTELVLIRDWLKHTLLGATRDDAAGEAFDKVARLLDLPYPGGPVLSKLAAKAKTTPSVGDSKHSVFKLPRPMINSPDFDFSFSGLKTAVLYRVNDLEKQSARGQPTLDWKIQIAADFQQAVIDVLLAKTTKAIEKYKPKVLIIAGGVSANQPLRQQFTKHLAKHFPKVKLLLPLPKLSLDNATMIAVTGYLRLLGSLASKWETIHAQGNLILD